MKRTIIILTVLFAAATVAQAQTLRMYTKYATSATTLWDSTGAGGYRANNFTVAVDSIGAGDTLFVAVNNDTAAVNVYPLVAGETKTFNTQALFVRTKAKTGTIRRRVDFNAAEVSKTPQASYWRAFVASDSLQRPADATAYAANDVMTSSTSAASMTLLRLRNVASANGGKFIITTWRVRLDTANVAAATYLATFIKDSSLATHTADNAPNVMTPQQFTNVAGEISGTLVATGAGSGSTVSWEFQKGLQLEASCASGSKDIYDKWIWTGAYQPKLSGKVYVEATGVQEVLAQ